MKHGQFLNFVVLLLHSNYNCWAITLEQPLVLAAEVGSAVNLSCHLNSGENIIDRVNIYWLFQTTKEKDKQYLYPDPTSDSIISKSSTWISNPLHDTDLSLTIADVRVPYSGLYICHASLLINSQNKGVTGNGTYLFVHEQLEIIVNGTDIICRTEVHTVENIALVWKFGAEESQNSKHGRLANSKDGFWMSSLLPNKSMECGGHNISATCLLQYMGKILAMESTEISCSGIAYGPRSSDEHKTSPPIHLYGLILGSSALILIILLTIWLIKWMNQRKNTVYAPYTNVSNVKTFCKM